MDEFPPGSVVWASARGDIFWPGRVSFNFNCSVCKSVLYFAMSCKAYFYMFDVRHGSKSLLRVVRDGKRSHSKLN